MISHTTARFRKAYRQLPSSIRKQAKVAYKLFQQNPRHPSLHFKQVHPSRPIYSVRASLDYRAVGNMVFPFVALIMLMLSVQERKG